MKRAKAQYNYHPDWTRPGGTGEVRARDPKRPAEGVRPGKPRSGGRRPKGSTR
jgi:hypothetical protein